MFTATTTTPILYPYQSWAVDNNNNNNNNINNNKASEHSSIVSPSTKPQQQQQQSFRSAAYARKEYTNSIVASRDTNISPLEVYETLEQHLLQQQKIPVGIPTTTTSSSSSASASISPYEPPLQRPLRALDVGAGAGVSTQVIYDMGYTEM
jgi:hypothetical protein